MLRLSNFLSGLFFIIWCIWSTHALCVGGHEDSEKIDSLTSSLLRLDPLKATDEDIRELVKQHHLNLTERPDDILHLYSEIKYVTRGSSCQVFKAKLAHDRPSVGLKCGDVIALRIVHSLPKPLSQHGFWPEYDVHLKLSQLTHPTFPAKPKTDYFPHFYGVYFTGDIPLSIEEQIFKEARLHRNFCNFRVEEMEWIDTTLERFDQKMPDSVLFELLLGEWVGKSQYGFSIQDTKLRNIGLKFVNHGRCYHLGGKSYYFSSNIIPIRIDLELVARSEVPNKNSFRWRSFPDNLETHNATTFRQELINGQNDIFTLFERHFSSYLKDPKWIIEHDPQAKHFHIDQSLIDYEKSLK